MINDYGQITTPCVNPKLVMFKFGTWPKTFLGSTHRDKQLLFSKFCFILAPSYWFGLVDGRVCGWLDLMRL